MLRPRKKLTRREIKEDSLVTAYVRGQKFIQNHSRIVNFGLIGLVIVLFLVILITRSKRQAEIRALDQLAMAEQVMYSQQNQLPIDEFLQVMELYPGTQAAGKACFMLATTYYNNEDYIDAQKYFEKYLDDYKNEKFYTISSIAGIANCYDNLEEYVEAAALYEKAAKKDQNEYFSPVYYRDAGRCYVLANQIEKGREMYQTIINKFPDVDFIREVKLHLEML